MEAHSVVGVNCAHRLHELGGLFLVVRAVSRFGTFRDFRGSFRLGVDRELLQSYTGFMTPFVAALKTEIAALEADIRDNPDLRPRRLSRLRETLAEYEPVGASTPAPSPVPANGPANGSTHPTSVTNPANRAFSGLPAEAGPAAMTKAARIKREIDAVLRAKPSAHRTELLDTLVRKGIMGAEKNPMQALAIYLSSHKEEYAFDGAGNYSLRPVRRLPLPG
jgi:hypothetical protein